MFKTQREASPQKQRLLFIFLLFPNFPGPLKRVLRNNHRYNLINNRSCDNGSRYNFPKGRGKVMGYGYYVAKLRVSADNSHQRKPLKNQYSLKFPFLSRFLNRNSNR